MAAEGLHPQVNGCRNFLRERWRAVIVAAVLALAVLMYQLSGGSHNDGMYSVPDVLIQEKSGRRPATQPLTPSPPSTQLPSATCDVLTGDLVYDDILLASMATAFAPISPIPRFTPPSPRASFPPSSSTGTWSALHPPSCTQHNLRRHMLARAFMSTLVEGQNDTCFDENAHLPHPAQPQRLCAMTSHSTTAAPGVGHALRWPLHDLTPLPAFVRAGAPLHRVAQALNVSLSLLQVESVEEAVLRFASSAHVRVAALRAPHTALHVHTPAEDEYVTNQALHERFTHAWVAQKVQFKLNLPHDLSPSEVSLLLRAVQRTCSSMHAAHVGRIVHAAGEYRDRCTRATGSSSRPAEQQGYPRDSSDAWYISPAWMKGEGQAGGWTSVPHAALRVVHVQVDATDAAGHARAAPALPVAEMFRAVGITLTPQPGEGDEVAAARDFMLARFAVINASTPADIHGTRALPHLNMNEQYGIVMARDEASITARMRSASVWGALRALATLEQLTEAWGVEHTGAAVTRTLHACALAMDVRTCSNSTCKVSACAMRASTGALGALSAVFAGRWVRASCVDPPAVLAACDVMDDACHARRLDGIARSHVHSIPIALPCVIVDAPWKRWRGLSYDTSRHFSPVRTLLRVIDGMAMHKLNTLHWHAVDAQSWPLALASVPELADRMAWRTHVSRGTVHETADDDAHAATDNITIKHTYTRADMVGIVQYAADRGIRVLLEVDMPAHTRALGLGDPQQQSLVRCDRAAVDKHDKYALHPGRNSTYAIVAVVLAELSRLFPDAQLHMGADEVVAECWGEDRSVHAWARENLQPIMAPLRSAGVPQGHSDEYLALLAFFLHRVEGVLAALGKAGVAWADSHEILSAADEALEAKRKRDDGRALMQGLHQRQVASVGSLQRARFAAVAMLRSHSGRVLREAMGDDFNVSSASPLVRYAFRGDTMQQAWKSWVGHGDAAMLDAADDGRSVLNAAGWYLDYSDPWAHFFVQWPLPTTQRTMQRLVELTRMAPNASALSPSVRAVLLEEGPIIGGEVAIWMERIDYTNVACRLWPRAAVMADVLWSQSGAYARVAAAVHAAGGTKSASWVSKLPSSQQDVLRAATVRFAAVSSRLWRAPHGGTRAEALFSWQPDDAKARLTADAYVSVAAGSSSSHWLLRWDTETSIRAPADQADTDAPPCNGWCPGIDHRVQRDVADTLPPAWAWGDETSMLPIARRRMGRLLLWNIDNGGSKRYEGILEQMRARIADVAVVIEAVGWELTPSSHREIAAQRAARTLEVREQLNTDARSMQASTANTSASPELDGSSTWKKQTIAFRRRAAAGGFSHAHLVFTKHGFHQALLSVHPITVVLEDTQRFQRGLLVVDTGGVRYVMAHLHAQSAVQRRVEAGIIAQLLRAYSAAGIPVVLAGDLNTLSPQDAHCHALQRVAAYMTASSTPKYLSSKYLTPAGEIDYDPMQTLLDAGMIDVALQPDDCMYSIPTGVVDDPMGAGPLPPMRIDFVLVNAQLLEAQGTRTDDGTLCQVLTDAKVAALSDHFPVMCEWHLPQAEGQM